MNMLQLLKNKKVWIRFMLLSVITYATVSMLSLSYLSKFHSLAIYNVSTVNEQLHIGCHAFNPQITPKHLFQMFFSILNDSVMGGSPGDVFAFVSRPSRITFWAYSTKFVQFLAKLFSKKA